MIPIDFYNCDCYHGINQIDMGDFVTINERIKYLRKDILQLNQTDFAKKLGMTQTGVSYMEKQGSAVTEQTIKTAGLVFGLNEDWLRYGTEPMYAEKAELSVDDYLHGREISDLEKSILQAYFELDPKIRRTLIQHFKNYLMQPVPETRSETEARLLREEADAVERGNGKSSASPATKEGA